MGKAIFSFNTTQMVINDSPNISIFDVDFQLDISQAVPKAIITDISTYIGGGAATIIGINVKILDPSNLYLPYTVYPPNVDIYPGLTDTEKILPYFNGQVKWGIYRLYTTLIDEDGTEYILTEEDGTAYKSITLCKPNSLSNATKNYGGLNLDVDPNCDYGMLIVQDGGTGFSYNGESPSETETNITITYPVDSTGATAQQVATFIPFTFPMTVSGIYTLMGTVAQTYQFTETTSVKAAYYYQNTFDVQCSYSLCKALCDYEKLVADVKNCSVKNPNEAVQQLKTLILVIAELGKIAWFKQCGKKFGNILENLRKIAGFACECECAPQGIAPAPFFMQGGTIVKGNMCGDIDLTLTQFMGNIKMDLSDVSYEVIASSNIEDFATITPVEGVCSKTFTLDIDVCAMLGTVSLSCLEDVNVGSPAPVVGDVLTWNGTEWQADSVVRTIVLFNDQDTHALTGIGEFNAVEIESNTISGNGDQVVIDTFFKTSALVADSPTVAIEVNGSSIFSIIFGSTIYGIRIQIEITRLTSNSAKYTVKYYLYDNALLGILYTGAEEIFGVPTSLVLDFTSDIEISTNFLIDSATAITISNMPLVIKHFRV